MLLKFIPALYDAARRETTWYCSQHETLHFARLAQATLRVFSVEPDSSLPTRRGSHTVAVGSRPD